MATGQWWVVLSGQSTISQILSRLENLAEPIPQQATRATVVQSATRPANYYKGPFATQALAMAQANAYNNPNLGDEAEEVLDKGPSSGSGASASNWSLDISGISGWFFRGLKVLFGGVLMIVGISKMLNIDNKITAIAGKIPVMA